MRITFNRIFFSILVLAVVLGGFFLAVPYRVYLVRDHSMEPNYQDGDWIVARKLRRGDSVQKGDVLVFPSPVSGELLIKRCALVPGDEVSLSHGWISSGERTYYYPSEVSPVEEGPVPPDSYFVTGDNLKVSQDSRVFGYIKGETIISKVVVFSL